MHANEGTTLSIKIRKGEIRTTGNRCMVHKATGDLIGCFMPNEMLIHDEGYCGNQNWRILFKPDGANPADWERFKALMRERNGRVIPDIFMPDFIREQLDRGSRK